MNKKECCLIKDILPLYTDDLISKDTVDIVKVHLSICDDCRNYYEKACSDLNIDIDSFMVDETEKVGRTTLKKIRKSQDIIKYSTIIFAMLVSIWTALLSEGGISVIPFIFIIPCALMFLFNEGKLIVVSGILGNFIIGTIAIHFSYAVIFLPLVVICVGGGVLFTVAIQKAIGWR